MAITVTGNLTDPLDNRLEGVEFRITSEISSGNTVTTAVATYITLADGFYSFTLVNGISKIEVRVGDTFEPVGDSIVDDSTPTPINLSDLLKYTTPIVPPTIINTDPIWEALFDDMRTDIDSFKQEQREQIVDGDTHHLDVDTVYTNERIDGGLAEEVKETKSRGAYTSNQTLAYGDANLQEASLNTTETTVGSNVVSSTDEVYSTSKGEVTTKSIVNSNTPNSNVISNTNVVDKGTDEVSMVLTVDHTTGKSLNKYNKTLADTTIASRVTVSEELDTAKFGHTATSRETTTTAVGYRDSNGVQLEEPITTEESINSLTTSFGESASTNRSHGVLVDSTGDIQNQITDTATTNAKVSSESLTNDGSTSIKAFDVDELNVGSDVFLLDVPNRRLTLNAQLVIGNPNDFIGDPGDTITEIYRYSPTATTFPDDGTWHEVFVTGDLYRITNRVTNGVVDPNNWTAPARLAAEDGHAGDTIYWDYRYSVDGATNWHNDLVDGDFWRQERLVTNGVPDVWSASARIAGTNGDDGQIVTVEYEYSIDGLTIWHTNFSTGDHYRRERIATYLFIGDPSPTYTAWSSPAKVVPVKGTDYLDGYNQATIFLYQRGTATPPLPTTVLTYDFSTKIISGALAGWTQSIPAGVNNIYIAAASAAGQNATDNIDPAEWSVGLMAQSGTTGVNGQIIRAVYQTATSAPATPTGTAIPPAGGWTALPPASIPTGEFTWVSYTYADDVTTLVGSGFWTNSTQLSGDSGSSGADGKVLRGVYQSAPASPVPALPSGTTIPPIGWLTNPPLPTTTDFIWVSYTYADDELTTTGSGNWTGVGQFSGATGWQAATVFLFRDSATALGASDTPTGDNTYRFSTGKIETTVNNSWTQAVPTNVSGKLWVTTGTASASANTATDVIPDTEWAAPKLWAQNGTDGSDGTDGTDGTNGADGAGFYSVVKNGGVFPTDDAVASADFVLHVGRSPIQDDHFTYLDAAGTLTTKSATKRFNGTTWVIPASIINGDLLVKGTITGDRLVAKTISGNEISSATTITAGNSVIVGPRALTNGSGAIDGLEDGWGYYDGFFGSMDKLEAFGTTVTGIYTSQHDFMGWWTYIRFAERPDRLDAPLLMTINGTEYNMGTWADDGTVFNTPDLQIFNLIADGAISTIVFNEIDSEDTINTMVGINGRDDGTGLGVDNVRIWAGALEEDAQTAPMRVMSDGSFYATNANITGDITGSNITGGTMSATIVNGTEINGATINAATIIGSTVYTTTQFIALDLDGDSNPDFYPDAPTIPIAAVQNLSYRTPTQTIRSAGSQMRFYTGLTTKYDTKLPVTTSRCAFASLVANTFTSNSNTIDSQNYGDTCTLTVETVSRDGAGTILSSTSGTFSAPNLGYLGVTTTTVNHNGLLVNFRFTQQSTFWPGYKLSISNSTSPFGAYLTSSYNGDIYITVKTNRYLVSTGSFYINTQLDNTVAP